MALWAEIVTSLTTNYLKELRQGVVGVLEDLLERPLSDEDRQRLALAYFNDGKVVSDPGVLFGIIEKLSEIEYGQVHGRGLKMVGL